ncbi:DNA-directed RNA polymerase sigma-70 factor [Bacteroidia bacterium]|nr:DNA-directed RNA polymerase sigma-70 factor [Bacteroidia bacterium]
MATNIDNIWISIRQGDVEAFELLYKKLYPELCYYASQLLCSTWLAEEAVQDLFLQLWESKEKLFSQNNSIRIYLYRTLHNHCLDILKKQQTQKHSFIQYLSSDAWCTISEKYGFDEQLIEQLESEEIRIRIDTVIENLPEQSRKIFKLSRMEGKTNEEIAKQMNLSVSTVKTQIYRAVSKIKQEISFIICIFLQIL